MRRGVCLQFTVYGLQMITRINAKSARKVIAKTNGKGVRKGVRGILSPLTSYLLPLTILLSCTSSPKDVVKVEQLPSIYPDYIGVTIPDDIAPLNFNFADEDIDCMDVVAKGSKGGEIHANGEWADFDIDDWHQLTEQN